MSDAARRESPLNQINLTAVAADKDASVLLAELPFQGLINLRGRPDDETFTKAVAATLGCELSLEPNTTRMAGDRTLFWLGPDEWMIVTPPDRQDALIDELHAALSDCFCSVVDVTSYYTTLAVGGRRAADLLAKGCTLDLHPQAFGVGQCAQTHVAKATVLIWPADAGSSFRLLVRRSYADYFGHWLNEAVREFGGAGEFDLARSEPPAERAAS
ncbi:MAG: sarcosine oxidase subunit gamma family protein [Candidatus Thiodiazotropha sp.]